MEAFKWILSGSTQMDTTIVRLKKALSIEFLQCASCFLETDVC